MNIFDIWIATGNWTIGVNNGNAALVTTNMTWYNDNGKASHTHEILNFRPVALEATVSEQGQEQQQPILVQPDNNSVSLRGVVDVGANHRIVWRDVQSTIDIKNGGKILLISLNDTQTNDHFSGRPIFGIVTSFIRCSDVPGPNMEMLPSCLNIPILPLPSSPAPSSASAVQSPPPSLTATTPPSNTITANNTLPSQTNFTASSQRPSSLLSLSSPSGNMTTNRPPPAASNATGKSPFDVLGGG